MFTYMLAFHSVTRRPLGWWLIKYVIYSPSKKMRLTSTSKVLLLCVLSLALISIFQSYKRLHKDWKNLCQVPSDINEDETNLKIKYILKWTSSNSVPFVYMGEGRKGFIDRKCAYTNCFVTDNKTLIGNYTMFDVIAFAGPEVVEMTKRMLPVSRMPHQKYVFASIESSQNYPICSKRYNNYFNWTWTYKIDSEVRWGYLVIKDIDYKIIGPHKDMHWLDWEDMEPVNEEFKKSLKTKTKIAAWFVSNCNSISNRENFALNLNKELLKYNYEIDIYGDCAKLQCPRDNESMCNNLIATTYYFYLSFENAFSEDYVTEKLLIAVQNNAVPIVYGGANYSRFLPSGSYLDARELGVEKLAKTMTYLVSNPDEYAEYFRWKNHYSYHGTQEIPETNEYCRMCELLNNEDMVTSSSTYEGFKEWWNPPDFC